MSEKKKPRGVVARFLAGETVERLGHYPPKNYYPDGEMLRVEAILRRALRKTKGGKG